MIILQRTVGYVFHCHSQKATHVFALVSPCHGPPLLLALLCDQFHSRHHFCDHEFGSPCAHVRILLFNGHEVQTSLVQSYGHYRFARYVHLRRFYFISNVCITKKLQVWLTYPISSTQLHVKIPDALNLKFNGMEFSNAF